jgi:general secretion pathway protein F
MAHPPPKPLTFQVRADLFNSLAGMEQAGLSVDNAVALLHVPGAGQKRLEQLRKLMSRGADIATAGEKSGLFTPVEVSLLRAALHAGSPATTYRRLADNYKQQARRIAAIKSRLSLPLLVLIVALFVNPLPSLVAGSLSGGGYLLEILLPLSLLLGMFYLAMRLKIWFEHTPPTRAQAWVAKQLTHAPLFGVMYVRRNNRDFFASMAMMLEAGISMFDALPKAVGTISNCVIREDFSRIKQDMTRGIPLSQAVEKLTYVGNTQIVGYIQTGEASGTLPEMLLRFANAETDAITHFQQQAATWLPRVAYGLIMLWLAYSILTTSAFMPHVPEEFQ